ncbi:MAG TPA: hypothetical protein VKQ30_09555 [Ktedonobacterales bacterium]|nr:hypothetical protein [Ktedonobacterales bacterium]
MAVRTEPNITNSDVTDIQSCAKKSKALTDKVASDTDFAQYFIRAMMRRDVELAQEMLRRAGLDPSEADISFGSQRICFSLGHWRWCVDVDWID